MLISNKVDLMECLIKNRGSKMNKVGFISFTKNTLYIHISFKRQCGNYGNSLSHLFDKNFVKVTFLLKKILKS